MSRVSQLILIAAIFFSGCATAEFVDEPEGSSDEEFTWGDGLQSGSGEEAGSAVEEEVEPTEPAEEEGNPKSDDAGCTDNDGDGYGNGCPLGPDCNDKNPNFQQSCRLCDVLLVEGCACAIPGKEVDCYEGTEENLSFGLCAPGTRTCSAGFWGPCLGQILPEDEVCDGEDNNCDGEVDEGVLSACGDCNEECSGFDFGPDTVEPFAPTGENSEGTGLTEEGWLTLDSEKLDLGLIWISNSGEGTVSKLDTKTGRELGRYITCADPSRTSVDLLGDVWVGCRGDGGVAKIRRHELACEDKNSNGVIDTSRDLNDDGVISGDEMLPGGADECIQFIVYPGGSKKRAAGVDGENHCWQGDWDDKVLRRLHPDTGEVVQSIPIPANPYGLVIDGSNVIWVAGRGGSVLLRVDPLTGQIDSYQSPLGETSPYGITLDYKGRVWLVNCCGHHVAYRFDPTNGQWAQTGVLARPRGIAGSLDGYIYVANDNSNSVAVVNSDTMQNVGQIDLGPDRTPVGMAVDFDGYVWAINQGTSRATKIDPANMAIISEHPVGSAPYTYSDMTGYTLHNFTAPQGHYTVTMKVADGFGTATSAESDGMLWQQVDIEADVPAGSRIEFQVRGSNDLDDLEEETWSDHFGPYPPQVLPADVTSAEVTGKYLQVRVWLYCEDQMTSPIVKKISASF